MAKKQIGILTFWYAVNPGSALQAYCLWKTINSLSPDIECHLINYQSTYYRGLFLKSPFKATSIKCAIGCFFLAQWYYRYQRFWKGISFAVKPKHRMDEKQLKLNGGGYDCYVVGSDQVWNTELTNKNYNFFLPFVSGVKKVSYAASIGLRDFPEDDKKAVESFLKDFSCISVREPAAQDAIEKLMGKRPQLVMDPTFLLNKKQYESITTHPNYGKYILLYLRHRNSKITPYARKMAKALGLRIVEVHDGIGKLSKEDIIVRYPDPKRWIGLINDAEYIFTDSFHGCAFCINLNKPFYVMISSANSEMSSRIYNILDKYQMTDRMITDQSDLMAMRDMSFDYSNKMLEQDRQVAIAYLKSALDLNE